MARLRKVVEMKARQQSLKLKKDSGYKKCQICEKQIDGDCHVIETKRKTTIYVCFDCIKQ